MDKLKVLDLFSGIGGFSLGLERTGGFETVAFCEINEQTHHILSKISPNAKIFNDVMELNYNGKVDVITGGFPCQDISISGRKKGSLEGERSSLYREMLKQAGIHKPRWIIFENVSNLLLGEGGLWFSAFLNDLAAIGYNAQWHSIPASSIGAGTHRDRIWIIAYPNKILWDGGQKIYNTIASKIRGSWTPKSIISFLSKASKLQFEENEPDHRMFDGLSYESHMQGALGNAVVPQIPEIIGHAILEVERENH